MAKRPAASPEFNHIADAAPEYVDVILWHRVALVAGGAVLILAVIGLILFRIMATTGDSTVAAADTTTFTPATLPASAAIAANSADTENVTESIQPAQNADHIHATITGTPATEPDTNADTNTELNSGATHNAEATPATSTQPAADETPSTTPAPINDTRFQVRTEILSPAVKRALITDNMRGREPGTAITDTGELSQQDSFSLFQFVDIRGHAGDTLTYHWKRNGASNARVRIPVGSDKWRNYSSKNFNRNLHGDWQVEVTNKKGILLVRSTFRVGE